MGVYLTVAPTRTATTTRTGNPNQSTALWHLGSLAS
jgi:hypothetical protein